MQQVAALKARAGEMRLAMIVGLVRRRIKLDTEDVGNMREGAVETSVSGSGASPT